MLSVVESENGHFACDVSCPRMCDKESKWAYYIFLLTHKLNSIIFIITLKFIDAFTFSFTLKLESPTFDTVFF